MVGDADDVGLKMNEWHVSRSAAAGWPHDVFLTHSLDVPDRIPADT